MAAVVGITYTLLHLSGSTPDLSNITGVIGGSARSSQTSETAQGNTNKKTNYQNAGTDHMNQNSKTNCESQAGSTNYEGQNMGTNYNNQGTNYNNQGPNYNNQGTNYNNQGPNYNYQSSGPNYSGSGVTPLKPTADCSVISFFRFLHAEFTVITLYTQLPAMLILLVPETENQQAD